MPCAARATLPLSRNALGGRERERDIRYNLASCSPQFLAVLTVNYIRVMLIFLQAWATSGKALRAIIESLGNWIICYAAYEREY